MKKFLLLGSIFFLGASYIYSYNLREIQVGGNFHYFLKKPLPTLSQTGGGISLSYNIPVSPSSWMGIYLGGKFTSQEESLAQMVYGLLIGHRIFSRWYVLYGLLLSMNFLSDRKGYATSHNTRLSVGYFLGERIYMDLSYHYSRIRYFEVDPIFLDRIEWEIGYRFFFRTSK